MPACNHCCRTMSEYLDANGDDDRYYRLCPRCDRPEQYFTIEQLGGIEDLSRPGFGAPAVGRAAADYENSVLDKPVNPKGTRSRRCSVCAIHWPPEHARCPQCNSETWTSKELPDDPEGA